MRYHSILLFFSPVHSSVTIYRLRIGTHEEKESFKSCSQRSLVNLITGFNVTLSNTLTKLNSQYTVTELSKNLVSVSEQDFCDKNYSNPR